MLSYLGDFLFPPQRAHAPVKTLSGGERNRLLLARLFAQPANLLVLDEPTNDLDIESLELLEATLQSYAGTLLLVSHDRAFLDNVVTQTLVAEGDGRGRSTPAATATGWRSGRGRRIAARSPRPHPRRRRAAAAGGGAGGKERGAGATTKPAAAPARVKLSFKEQRELDALPAELEALEREQQALTARMSSPDYFRQGADAIKADRERAEHRALMAAKFERWAELEARAAPTGR